MPSSPASGQPAPGGKPPATNTLRLQGQELARLLDELEASSPSGGSKFKRDYLRWVFQKPDVRVDIHQPGGVPTSLRYACRNLSGSGIALLHSSYIHTGTACTVYLPRPTGEMVAVEGKVVRCRHVRGNVHECGVKFKNQIKLADFLDIDPFMGRFTLEHVDPDKLVGSLLHIEDSPTDRRLVRHYLKETGLNVVNAEDGPSGLERAAEGFDLIICDLDLPGLDGPGVCEQLRAKGVQTPVLMLTADTRAFARERSRDAGANAFLQKPVSRDQLLRALAEFLITDGKGADGLGPLVSTLRPDDPEFSFVPEFVDELHENAKKLAKMLETDDAAAARRLCSQLMGVAPSLGFPVIADVAEAAYQAITASMSVTESSKPVRSLIAACMRAKSTTEKHAA